MAEPRNTGAKINEARLSPVRPLERPVDSVLNLSADIVDYEGELVEQQPTMFDASMVISGPGRLVNAEVAFLLDGCWTEPELETLLMKNILTSILPPRPPRTSGRTLSSPEEQAFRNSVTAWSEAGHKRFQHVMELQCRASPGSESDSTENTASLSNRSWRDRRAAIAAASPPSPAPKAAQPLAQSVTVVITHPSVTITPLGTGSNALGASEVSNFEVQVRQAVRNNEKIDLLSFISPVMRERLILLFEANFSLALTSKISLDCFFEKMHELYPSITDRAKYLPREQQLTRWSAMVTNNLYAFDFRREAETTDRFFGIFDDATIRCGFPAEDITALTVTESAPVFQTFMRFCEDRGVTQQAPFFVKFRDRLLALPKEQRTVTHLRLQFAKLMIEAFKIRQLDCEFEMIAQKPSIKQTKATASSLHTLQVSAPPKPVVSTRPACTCCGRPSHERRQCAFTEKVKHKLHPLVAALRGKPFTGSEVAARLLKAHSYDKAKSIWYPSPRHCIPFGQTLALVNGVEQLTDTTDAPPVPTKKRKFGKKNGF